jgi:hypothetical protein
MDKGKPDLKKTERLTQNTNEYVKRYWHFIHKKVDKRLLKAPSVYATGEETLIFKKPGKEDDRTSTVDIHLFPCDKKKWGKRSTFFSLECGLNGFYWRYAVKSTFEKGSWKLVQSLHDQFGSFITGKKLATAGNFRLYWLAMLMCSFKGKAIPLQAWTGPEGSRRFRLPEFKTIGIWRR